MANKHMKKCSISLAIKEMQIKTTLRFHLTLVRMVIIKKTSNNNCSQAYERIKALLPCWWECKVGKPLWKSVCRFTKSQKTELPYYLAVLLLGIYLKDYKSIYES
jgi:hypothetical protein